MLSNFNLHTLRVLDEIFKTGSLSRTADRLQLSQPAISIVLAKLRTHFDDKLFVRVGNEMKPTAQAEGMRESIAAAIAAIETVSNYRHMFDPATTTRVFRVAVSDIGQIVMVPSILRAFQAEAPFASLEFNSINGQTSTLLLTGMLDLAVGPDPGMPDNFLQRLVFTEAFCVLARKNHPRIRGSLSLEQFSEEGHIRVVTLSSTHLLVEKVLQESKIKRKVQISVPNFMMVGQLVRETDYLSVLPWQAGLVLAANHGLQVLTPPLIMPEFPVQQYWHERQSNDYGNRWLRDLFMRLFGR